MNSTHWPLAGVAALLLTMQAQAADGQTIYAQGGANPAAMACATCHGADAMGMAAAGFPRLAGIAAGYSRKQLEDFRSGARSNPIMQPIAAALTDEEMNAVAATLEAMPAPTFAATSRAEKAEGVGARLAAPGSATFPNAWPAMAPVAWGSARASRHWPDSRPSISVLSSTPGARARARTIRMI